MIGIISRDNQVIDMSDWDLSAGAIMKESMDIVRNRRARAIVMSTAMGITKFRSQSKREDPHRLMRGQLVKLRQSSVPRSKTGEVYTLCLRQSWEKRMKGAGQCRSWSIRKAVL